MEQIYLMKMHGGLCHSGRAILDIKWTKCKYIGVGGTFGHEIELIQFCDLCIFPRCVQRSGVFTQFSLICRYNSPFMELAL